MSTPALFPKPCRRPAPGVLHIEVGKRTAWLYGNRVPEVFNPARIGQRQWNHRRRVRVVPAGRTDDVPTAAELFRRRTVTVTQVDR